MIQKFCIENILGVRGFTADRADRGDSGDWSDRVYVVTDVKGLMGETGV